MVMFFSAVTVFTGIPIYCNAIGNGSLLLLRSCILAKRYIRAKHFEKTLVEERTSGQTDNGSEGRLFWKRVFNEKSS